MSLVIARCVYTFSEQVPDHVYAPDVSESTKYDVGLK